MRTSVLLLLTLFSTAVLAKDDVDCAKIWDQVRRIHEVEEPQFRVPQVPEQGVISGLSFKSLYFDNDRRFIPASLAESNCSLDRMLGQRVREAVRAGAIAYTRTVRKRASEERVERLSTDIDTELDKSFVPLGMAPGTGLNRIRSLMQNAFDIQLPSKQIRSPLQKLAFDSHLYTPSAILTWLQVAYVQHLGVDGFNSEELIEALRALDASYGPPRNLKVRDCAEPLGYQWPTVSLPISTYKDIDEYDVVHWAVCKPSGDIWVYHYRRGWKKAQSTEKAQVCEEQGSEEPFHGFCAH